VPSPDLCFQLRTICSLHVLKGGNRDHNQEEKESGQEETDVYSHILTYEEAMRAGNDIWSFEVSKSSDLSERLF
jgi:hypothetical protein